MILESLLVSPTLCTQPSSPSRFQRGHGHKFSGERPWLGEHLSPMIRVESAEGAGPREWIPRHHKGADDDGDTDSIMSFGCSLVNEFDRQQHRRDSDVDGPAVGVEARQAWLDTIFVRLSRKGRKSRDGSSKALDDASKVKSKAKPHFLDLSAYINPLPISGQDSPPLPPSASTTPRPSYVQRFFSSENVNATPRGSSLSHAHNSRPKTAGVPADASMALPAGTPLSSPLSATFAGSESSGAPRPALRTRRSFENHGAAKRRQREDWESAGNPSSKNAQLPVLPDWARENNRSLSISSASSHASSYFSAPSQQTESRRPSDGGSGGLRPSHHDGPPRPTLMTRASSNDTRTSRGRPPLMTRASSNTLPYADDWNQPPPPPPFADHNSSPPISMTRSRSSAGSESTESSGSGPQTPVSTTPERKRVPLPKEADDLLESDDEDALLQNKGPYELKVGFELDVPPSIPVEHAKLSGAAPRVINLTPRAGRVHAARKRPELAQIFHQSPPQMEQTGSTNAADEHHDDVTFKSSAPVMLPDSSNSGSPPQSTPSRSSSFRARLRTHSTAGRLRASTVSSTLSVETTSSASSLKHSEDSGSQYSGAGSDGRPESFASSSTTSGGASSPSSPSNPRRRTSSKAEDWASSIGRRFARGMSGKERAKIIAATNNLDLSD